MQGKQTELPVTPARNGLLKFIMGKQQKQQQVETPLESGLVAAVNITQEGQKDKQQPDHEQERESVLNGSGLRWTDSAWWAKGWAWLVRVCSLPHHHSHRGDV